MYVAAVGSGILSSIIVPALSLSNPVQWLKMDRSVHGGFNIIKHEE